MPTNSLLRFLGSLQLSSPVQPLPDLHLTGLADTAAAGQQVQSIEDQVETLSTKARANELENLGRALTEY